MKIKFIGVGSAFTTQDYYQSNLLITAPSGKRLLLDCGSDARFALAESEIYGHNVGDMLDAIYISHLHADHIGGLEWLAFSTFFNPNAKKLKLFIEEQTMQQLWDQSLRGGLERLEGQQLHLTDYFDCHPLAKDGTFSWEGINFTLSQMLHVDTGSPTNNHYSYGLSLTADFCPNIFITTDTKFNPDFIIEIANKVDLIFHDCETTPYNTPVHAHYTELRTLPLFTKRKIWLYHYQSQSTYQPEEDGFRGFVLKGQEFDFSSKNAGELFII
jgi:ribonuclease BN (tRNA processing enzyme)